MTTLLKRIRTEVCIVGAGPVGVALAGSLADTGIESTVVESGTESGLPEGVPDPVLDVVFTSHPYPHPMWESRTRSVGGTSIRWPQGNGLRSRPLDPIDLVPRPDGRHDGWPIGEDDLRTALREACDFLRLAPDFVEERPADAPPDGVFETADGFERGHFLIADARVVDSRIAELRACPACTILPRTHVVEILTSDDGSRVTGVEVVSETEGRLIVEAETVVLCAGGIENPRLLLASDRANGGLGNRHDLVGRFFMEHPHTDVGLLRARHGVDLTSYDRVPSGTGKVEPFLRLPLDRIADEGLPNFSVWFKRRGRRALVRDLLDARTGPGPASPAERDRLGVGDALGDLLHSSAWGPLGSGDANRVFLVEVEFEQFPDRRSRVALADVVDDFGVPRAELHWRFEEEAKDELRRLLDRIHRSLDAVGVGRIVPRPNDGKTEFGVGNHHMGTTRMSHRPEDGVVDTDLQVHGVDGLYVAGTSVFPSGGAANPTLVAIATATRLARHLAERRQPAHLPATGS